MRVLLVTWSDNLLQKLQILSPHLEYCAIVVDEIEPAQKILERVNLPKSLLRPMYELKECVRDFYYDYVICLENVWWGGALSSKVQKYGVPRNKVLNFCALTFVHNFLLERSLRYFKEHAAEFDMFATGISLVEKCLDVTQFKRKLFNFGRGSQDLHYNFQVAKHAVAYGGVWKTSLRADRFGTVSFPLRPLEDAAQSAYAFTIFYLVRRLAQFLRARQGLPAVLAQRIFGGAIAA